MYHISEDKRSFQSSEWIYMALKDLSDEKKYESINITDIVNRANIGRSTFYRNFDTKDDVLRFKCDQKCIELKEYLLEYQSKNEIPLGPLLTKPFTTFWSKNSSVIELLIKVNRINILHESYADILRKYYNDNIDNMDEMSLKYADYILEANVSSAIAVLVKWIKNNKRESPEDLSQIVIYQTMQNFLKLNIHNKE
ncbi:TetR/AcrR family transcriptional regulator [Clostridium sp. AL.422]|uniref:TetR/AcrR family transcriptional regulator n=1 Tax=Clostridium TaxID=1485 RepID=UPI00293DD78C|nr:MULTISPECIES: TetR/AcrR family transcriptional regulator [unclassified Clostridium]MDV4150853.1 TetR/AcrR family transcriptional regulator [Clostridium sp. AL.422]